MTYFELAGPDTAPLVVLAAGLEMDFQRVLSAMRGRGMVVATLGFVLPFGGGLLIAWAYELDSMRTVFMGLCIAITALPVAARMLADMGMPVHVGEAEAAAHGAYAALHAKAAQAKKKKAA